MAIFSGNPDGLRGKCCHNDTVRVALIVTSQLSRLKLATEDLESLMLNCAELGRTKMKLLSLLQISGMDDERLSRGWPM
jgi:hypothetical protein